MLRNLEHVACYYITGSYKTQDYGFCMRTPHYRDLAYAISFLPYYWRAMQVNINPNTLLLRYTIPFSVYMKQNFNIYIYIIPLMTV